MTLLEYGRRPYPCGTRLSFLRLTGEFASFLLVFLVTLIGAIFPSGLLVAFGHPSALCSFWLVKRGSPSGWVPLVHIVAKFGIVVNPPIVIFVKMVHILRSIAPIRVNVFPVKNLVMWLASVRLSVLVARVITLRTLVLTVATTFTGR